MHQAEKSWGSTPHSEQTCPILFLCATWHCKEPGVPGDLADARTVAGNVGVGLECLVPENKEVLKSKGPFTIQTQDGLGFKINDTNSGL